MGRKKKTAAPKAKSEGQPIVKPVEDESEALTGRAMIQYAYAVAALSSPDEQIIAIRDYASRGYEHYESTAIPGNQIVLRFKR